MARCPRRRPSRSGSSCGRRPLDWPSIRDAAVRAERAGAASLWTWDHLNSHRRAVGGPDPRGLVGPRRLVAGHEPRDARAHGRGEHVPQPRASRRSSRSRSTTSAAAAPSSASAGPGSSASTRRSGSTSARASASGSTGSTSRWGSCGGCSTASGSRTTRAPRTGCTTRSSSRGPSSARLPIMIGGSGPKKTLRTLARYGDQWNTSAASIEALKAKDDVLRERCAEIGRDPATIEKTVTVDLVIRDTRAAALDAYRAIIASHRPGLRRGVGDPRRRAGRGRRQPPADHRPRVPARPRRHARPVRRGDDRPDRRGARAPPRRVTRVVALAGGVGGAKLADGLAGAHRRRDLTVVVNTGDDCWRHGLLVMPDHDTVLYNLAGIEQVEWGWGIEGDTHAAMDQLGVYGEETWFRLGDRDLALHIVRTARLRAGARLTDACLGRAAVARDRRPDPADERRPGRDRGPHRRTAGSSSRSTSSTSARSRTCSSCGSPGIDDGRADARGRWRPSPTPRRSSSRRRTRSSRSRRSSTCPACATAIAAARARGVPVAAVSPIIGGKALKGPADRMLAALGHEASALGVARLYAGPRRRLRARHGGRRRRRRRSRRSGCARS